MERYYELGRDEENRSVAWYAENNQCNQHFHSSIEIVYVLSGSLVALLDGEKKLVGQNEMIVNSCYSSHCYRTEQENKLIIATIPLSALPLFTGRLMHSRFACNVIKADTPLYKRLIALMADSENRANAAYIDSLAQALIALLVERVGLVPRKDLAEGDWFDGVLRYVYDNMDQPLTVGSVASEFGYSVGRFSHLFTQRVGISFSRYLQGLRCEKARNLLRQGSRSVNEVSETCGFQSVRTFHRVYKGITGKTPKEMGGKNP